jgi:hypothetical protein
MKKSELKNMIKECVKEVIFEEGVLSGIITEVAHGLQGSTILQENRTSHRQSTSPHPSAVQREESKKQVLAAIGKNSYEDVRKNFSNPALFEGTQPIPTGDEKSPLAGVGPRDPGLDITTLPGFSNWGDIAKNIGK